MPTQDQVRQAIAELEAQGAHVSPATIRQQLGGYGSFRDIVEHHKQLASEAARRPATNGTQAATPPPQPAPPPAPLPAPPPPGDRARLEQYLGLARQRKADLEAALSQLRVRAERFMPMHEVREFNRKIVGTERAIEAAQRDIVQYLSELSRLR